MIRIWLFLTVLVETWDIGEKIMFWQTCNEFPNFHLYNLGYIANDSHCNVDIKNGTKNAETFIFHEIVIDRIWVKIFEFGVVSIFFLYSLISLQVPILENST